MLPSVPSIVILSTSTFLSTDRTPELSSPLLSMFSVVGDYSPSLSAHRAVLSFNAWFFSAIRDSLAKCDSYRRKCFAGAKLNAIQGPSRFHRFSGVIILVDKWKRCENASVDGIILFHLRGDEDGHFSVKKCWCGWDQRLKHLTVEIHFKRPSINYFWPVSQRSPTNPDGQLQIKPFVLSTQVPSFKHGLLSHSFTSTTKRITKN